MIYKYKYNFQINISNDRDEELADVSDVVFLIRTRNST